ncbi:MAG: hypothetical protein KF819_02675 [Labilithrix sp.]|nr:hypothetical protein [Labilithrix sp.]
MRKIHLAVASLSLAAALLGSGSAAAEETKSQHGGGYVAGNVLGFSIISVPGVATPFGTIGGGAAGAYHMDFEGGYHFSGTHDGFMAGLRQGFNFGSGSSGATQAKFGYSLVFPISGGPSEIIVTPYTVLGAAYGFSGGDPSFAFGFGAEVRYFINESGLFVGGHPLELGGWVPGGFTYTFGLGAGYAF